MMNLSHFIREAAGSAQTATSDALKKQVAGHGFDASKLNIDVDGARHTHAKPSSCSSCCVQLRGWGDHSLVRVTSALIVPLAIGSTTFGERKERGSWTRR